jgi:(2S)-methylsuccinyl-CoA dehydrogenase
MSAALPAPGDALAAARAAALDAAQRLVDALLERLRDRVGRPPRADALERDQAAAHGVAWAATCVRALRETHGWTRRLAAACRLGELEVAIADAAFAEYLAQLAGGLPMSQGEIFRPDALDPEGGAAAAFAADPAVRALRATGFAPQARARIAARLVDGRAARAFGDAGHDDPALDEIRTQFGRWSDDHAGAAHRWHLADALIPDATIADLAALGVFGLTVPEAWGGSGLGKGAMCVVTEELSRGWIGLGSLGTRTEIAGELILGAGTDAQRARWLPGLVDGTVIPTASFTEPDTGSDLASLRTRAERSTDDAGRPCWRIHGAKTWTTHGARSDMMTLLARTDRDAPGYRGLSMFLVPKPRGTDDDPFPAPGMSGGEIQVLGTAA